MGALMPFLALMSLLPSLCAAAPMVEAGPAFYVYRGGGQPGGPAWYINDHTIVRGPGGLWNLFGITHTEPADPQREVNFAHAQSSSLTDLSQWRERPFALGAFYPPETLLWAPHVVFHDGLYHMFYCAGGVSREAYHLRQAVSKDLLSWERLGTLFEAGVDGRDPMLLDLGADAQRAHRFVLYYTGTNPDSVTAPNVSHVTFCRQSSDLFTWGAPSIAFDAGPDGANYGGPTESPFVVRRGPLFYLLSGAWGANYTDTRVFLSRDPTNFGSVPLGTAQQVGEINSHAPEVVRDADGSWYVSAAGWGAGGVRLAKLTWFDGCDDCPTNLPVPETAPATPSGFASSLAAPWTTALGTWVEGAEGLHAGEPLDNAFRTASNLVTPGGNVSCVFEVRFVTTDGNPTSAPNNNTRVGTAAGIVFGVTDPSAPLSQATVLNLFTNDGTGGAGVKLFRFPYETLAQSSSRVVQDQWYAVRVAATPGAVSVHVDNVSVLNYTGAIDTAGSVGVYVWQGAATFQNLFCDL
jgi:arabinan endo-1,5-alpha-L-arabinosidase